MKLEGIAEQKGNVMRQLRVAKITLNIGAGKSTEKLEKGLKLLKAITGITPVKTFTNKRIPTWGLRPGLPIGCKLTLRKAGSIELLKRLIQARDNRLIESQFDGEGNVAFGIPEYIDIPGANYDPLIGIMGMEVCVTLERPGYRVKRRKIMKKRIPGKHRISKQEAIDFMREKFGVMVVSE
ncbi:TPA: 50S ribosomal protein L5 [Candidatus Woesearchaeota archaeon]|nr:50S ribosomal protein L5P [uncultured archaeon]HIG98066.1 50S ribosomal protein L5 [Candidatus Woesearchaeota archaeon]